jgi:hypothetical protein
MALLHSPRIVTDGLVLCLDAANRKSYPGSGTVWRDLAGSNNGTLTNGPTFSSANMGSIVFDGSNDYVANNNIISDKPLTISFWSKINATKNQCFYCSRTEIGRGISIFGLGLGGPQNTVRFDTGLDQWTTGYNIPINTWVNINLLVDSSNKTLFVNGVLHSTTPFSSSIVNISTSLFTIGASHINGTTIGNFLNGTISNYFIYNRALTPTEIQQNYNATKGRFKLT